jgi:hypothetical protein
MKTLAIIFLKVERTKGFKRPSSATVAAGKSDRHEIKLAQRLVKLGFL